LKKSADSNGEGESHPTPFKPMNLGRVRATGGGQSWGERKEVSAGCSVERAPDHKKKKKVRNCSLLGVWGREELSSLQIP